jgi:two-component system, OmpR family, sensor histidine kinase TctE
VIAHSTSLTRRLLLVLVGSLSVVALILGIGGAWLIDRVAEETADRVLAASARAIAETLTVERGEVTIDLPASALGMLENNERDNVYYSVHVGNELLTGYPDLPTLDAMKNVPLDTTILRYTDYSGAQVRVASEVRRLPRITDPVVVQVAETLVSRKAVAGRLLAGLVLLEVLFVAGAAMLVLPAVRWSLRPATKLQKDIEAQGNRSADFTAIDITGVPAELQGLVVAFNSLLGSLKAVIDRMTHFTADASHQLRTPLAVLRTHIAVLRREGTERPSGRVALEEVERAAVRLQRLLVQLVTLARAEEIAIQPLQLVPVDLLERVEAVIERMEQANTDHKPRLRLEVHQDPGMVMTEPDLLGEVLFNLLDNALRYSPTHAIVTVEVCLEDEVPRIAIRDQGPGIPSESREQVFQRFHRLARNHGTEGSGLGLPIVRTLAKELGITVDLGDVEAMPGLCVTLRLPPVAKGS